MDEIWKDIEGFERCYQVSNLGRVKSLARIINHANIQVFRNERIIKNRFDKDGYLHVSLYKNNKGKTYKVHRLVAHAFIHNPYKKTEVNHINGVKTNNRVENLEWVTHKENVCHALSCGLSNMEEMRKGYQVNKEKILKSLSKRNSGKQNYFSKYPEDMINKIREMASNGVSLKEISRYYNISYHYIQDIVKGRVWSCISGNIVQTNLRLRPVLKIKDGKIIQKYNSIEDATKEFPYPYGSGIVRCCKGKLKSCKGYVWQYAD